MMMETAPTTIPPHSHIFSAIGTAPIAVSVWSALRSCALTVLTMNRATIASTPGTYTIYAAQHEKSLSTRRESLGARCAARTGLRQLTNRCVPCTRLRWAPTPHGVVVVAVGPAWIGPATSHVDRWANRARCRSAKTADSGWVREWGAVSTCHSRAPGPSRTGLHNPRDPSKLTPVWSVVTQVLGPRNHKPSHWAACAVGIDSPAAGKARAPVQPTKTSPMRY